MWNEKTGKARCNQIGQQWKKQQKQKHKETMMRKITTMEKLFPYFLLTFLCAGFEISVAVLFCPYRYMFVSCNHITLSLVSSNVPSPWTSWWYRLHLLRTISMCVAIHEMSKTLILENHSSLFHAESKITFKWQATDVQTVKPLDFKFVSSMHNSVMLHTRKKPIRARSFLSQNFKRKKNKQKECLHLSFPCSIFLLVRKKGT